MVGSGFLHTPKALDCVYHNTMIYKLDYCGIRGVPLSWIHSYLSNRNKFVKIADTQFGGRGLA